MVTDVLSSKITVLGTMLEAYGMFSALQKVPMESATRSMCHSHSGAAQQAAWEEFSFLGRCCTFLMFWSIRFGRFRFFGAKFAVANESFWL